VILDMILRDHEDGLIVFERILRHFPKQRGLLVSGHSPPERSTLAFELGLSWLSKPYTSEALARAVHTAVHPSLRPLPRNQQ
jgi:DNA-binding NtrC family response regulator